MKTRISRNAGPCRTVKTFVVMVAVAVSALLYVWQHIVITKLGYRIHHDERKFEELIDEKARLQSRVSRMESPANIMKCLASANLELKPVKNPSVVRVRRS
jgi:cell division protein FtsL